ncbi:MAG: tRNA methyltransferase [Holosporaceae bacterium]|jgi:tRNA (cytidine/uridine-2'-O-)-methyltransferase|nr:tRNA methyltransferase [Holosporaceae bacterium]
MLNVALYHPQIPQNTGTLLRLASCLGFRLDLIRPFGFVFSNKNLRRAAMDYIATADYFLHDSFDAFWKKYQDRRIIALDSNEHISSVPHHDFSYDINDILLVGSEHYGFLPEDLIRLKYRVRIPMLSQRRSLNMAVAAAMVVGEAMSQLKLYRDASDSQEKPEL